MTKALIALALASCASLAIAQPADDRSIDAAVARIVADVRNSDSGSVRGAVTTLEARMKALGVPGVSVAVIRNGRIAWARAWGVQAAGGELPIDTATLFQAASISKPVAAAGVLRLVDAGRIALDDDLARRLTRWHWPASRYDSTEPPITLRTLMTHTSGLTVGGFPGYPVDGRPLPSVEQVLNGTNGVNTPGIVRDTTITRMPFYSGGGYTVMQLVAEEMGRASFASLLDSLVLRPLGMAHSAFAQPLDSARAMNAAIAHGFTGRPYPTRWHMYPELAAAGLWTTPSDLARFLIGVRAAARGERRDWLSQRMARAMMSPDVPPYGLGLSAVPVADDVVARHGGANAGFRCLAWIYRDAGHGIVVMTNGDRGTTVTDELMGAIAREYGWADLPRGAPMGRSPQRPRSR
jgi:CubicO group peptidase (beta-lactamase class C family)